MFRIDEVYVVQNVDYSSQNIRRVWMTPLKDNGVQTLMMDVTSDNCPVPGDKLEITLTNRVTSHIPSIRRDFYLGDAAHPPTPPGRGNGNGNGDKNGNKNGDKNGCENGSGDKNKSENKLNIPILEEYELTLTGQVFKGPDPVEKKNDEESKEEKFIKTKQLWISAGGLLIWFSTSLSSKIFDAINIKGSLYYTMLRHVI
jgi:hypothetical protein